jgi:hypothetical protein
MRTPQKPENQLKKFKTNKRIKNKIKKIMSNQDDSKYIMATYSDFKETKMTFGKYKGFFLKDIPIDYIKWLIINVKDRGLCEMYAIELQRRKPSLRKSKQ